MNENINNSFQYIYSAKQQNEIKMIRDKYIDVEEDKIRKLRKLDESTTKSASIISLILGIIGLLLFGSGMSLCLVWTDTFMSYGICVGVIGMIICSINYPIYVTSVNRNKKKVAKEIVALADELLK